MGLGARAEATALSLKSRALEGQPQCSVSRQVNSSRSLYVIVLKVRAQNSEHRSKNIFKVVWICAYRSWMTRLIYEQGLRNYLRVLRTIYKQWLRLRLRVLHSRRNLDVVLPATLRVAQHLISFRNFAEFVR